MTGDNYFSNNSKMSNSKSSLDHNTLKLLTKKAAYQ